MNTTPRKNGIDFQDSDLMSTTELGNSPCLTVRDYKNNVEHLSNENFTLKLVLLNLQKEFRMFLKSKNINDDVIDLIESQRKTVSALTAEIGQSSEIANSGISGNSKVPPQSPSLKQELIKALDDNIQLRKELKEKENQQYDSVMESSILFDDGVQASITNLELNNKIKELNNKLDALSNENDEYQKENNKLKQKIANLTQALQKQQDLNDYLNDAENRIKELELKNAQLSKDHVNIDDMNNALSQLEDLTEKNNLLMNENMKLKEDNEVLSQQVSDQNDLIEELKKANDKYSISNTRLLAELKAHDVDEAIQKIKELLKENEEFQKQNKSKDQLMKSPNSNSSNSDLKEQIYKLKAEIQRLQLQLQHQKELKTGDYDDLVMKNQALKEKKRAIQSSINRFNSGINSNPVSLSFSPRKNIQSPTTNIESLWNEAKSENDKLTKDIDELHNLLDEKLYSKINFLLSDPNQIHSLQKEINELKNRNNSLLRDLNNLQNENLALAQQIEIIKGENEDLAIENDGLRRQPRFNSMATTPIRFSLNNSGTLDNSQIDDLKNQIEKLQNENLSLAQQIEIIKGENEDLVNENDSLRRQPRFNSMATTPIRFSLNNSDTLNNSLIDDLKKQNELLQNENKEKDSEIETLRSENLKLMHDKIQSPNYNKKDIFSDLQKEKMTRSELSKYMNEIVNRIDDKINSFIDDFEECFKGLTNNFHNFIGLILTLTHSVNSGNRQQFLEMAQFGKSIISDMRKGALICLNNCKGIKLDSSNPPLISRDDRKKLTMLQKKWKTPVSGDLGRFINEENERSLLFNNPSLIGLQNDLPKIIEQLQFIIHNIWNELGNGDEEPHISSIIQWKENGDEISQRSVNLLIESVRSMRKSIEKQKQQLELADESGLSPYVINLIQLVRRDIGNIKEKMTLEHNELIEEINSQKK